MKTPREILFARHRTVEPKLDAVRRGVMGELNRDLAGDQSLLSGVIGLIFGFPKKMWMELVTPCRRIWLGFAAVWILLFMINSAQRDTSENVVAQAAPPAGMMMAYRDQQKMLEELLAEKPGPTAEERPHRAVPKPRSEVIETVDI